jgi:hypothetical protein
MYEAGLGTHNQKSVAPLVWRVQLRPAYNFFCLLYAKWSTRNKNGPHGVSRSPPVIHRNTLLGPLRGSGDVTTQYKTQVKSMTRGPAIQEPKFSVCDIVFDGGCDGRGCGCQIFLALHARPSHTAGAGRAWPNGAILTRLCYDNPPERTALFSSNGLYSSTAP